MDISHQIDLLELLSELNREKAIPWRRCCTILIRPVVTPAIDCIAGRENCCSGSTEGDCHSELIERIYGLRCMIIDDPVAERRS